jgi:hypothetical protein
VVNTNHHSHGARVVLVPRLRQQRVEGPDSLGAAFARMLLLDSQVEVNSISVGESIPIRERIAAVYAQHLGEEALDALERAFEAAVSYANFGDDVSAVDKLLQLKHRASGSLGEAHEFVHRVNERLDALTD